MKLFVRAVKPLAAICVVAFSASAFAQNVAVVNGKAIPKSRADAFIEELVKQGQQNTPQLQSLVRQELIDREILVQEAERRGLSRKNDIQFQISNARQEVLINALVQDQLTKSPITDAEVKAEYDRLTQGNAGKEFRARHILVETENEAKAVIEQLKKGGKFEEIAKKQSKDPGSAAQGGDLDWADVNSFVEPFSKAVAGLEKGKLTEAPIQTQFGWHVIRLDDVRTAQPPAFDQVKDQIMEVLRRKKLQDFQQQLKAKAKVQ